MLVTPGLPAWIHTGENGNPVLMQSYRSIDHLTTVCVPSSGTEAGR